MARPGEVLALRKDVLRARSSLCRLRIRREVHALREGLHTRPALLADAAASPERTAAFLLASEGLGRERTARWLAFALRALAIARVTRLALALLRRPPEGPRPP